MLRAVSSRDAAAPAGYAPPPLQSGRVLRTASLGSGPSHHKRRFELELKGVREGAVGGYARGGAPLPNALPSIRSASTSSAAVPIRGASSGYPRSPISRGGSSTHSSWGSLRGPLSPTGAGASAAALPAGQGRSSALTLDRMMSMLMAFSIMQETASAAGGCVGLRVK